MALRTLVEPVASGTGLRHMRFANFRNKLHPEDSLALDLCEQVAFTWYFGHTSAPVWFNTLTNIEQERYQELIVEIR
jgi:hypothetical protein